MKRLAVILLLSMSGVMAGEESGGGNPGIPSSAQAQVKKAAEPSVGWRTMVVAAALILSPLFAGWALGRAKSSR